MTDPHPTANRFVGKYVRFLMNGKEVRGIVLSQSYIGPKGPTAIPDYQLHVKSTKTESTTTISMYDSWAFVD